MPNATSRRKVPRSQAQLGVKREGAGTPGAPVHVTDDAQASIIDTSALQDFVFKAQQHDDLPARPSTSGGSIAIPSSWTYPEGIRGPRDDLYLYTRHAPDGGMTFFNFPIPGSAPAPPGSFIVSPPQLKSSTRWPLTPTSAISPPPAANMSVQPMEIGMALGSPSHQPATWPAGPSFDVSTISPSPDPTDDGGVSEAGATKHKSSRWKPLRAIFGHKRGHVVPQQPFYQLKPESPFGTTVTTIEGGPFENEEPVGKAKTYKTRLRGRSFSGRRTDKHKLDVKRSATTPVKFNFDNLERGRSQARTQGALFGNEYLMSEPEDVDSARLHQDHMLLDVNIPSIQMERYSIMFGSVLNQSGVTTSSSLLARRQATLDKLRTVNEELALKEREIVEKSAHLMPRRATSPNITKSPAFSLFPQPPGSSRLNVYDDTVDRKSSPLQRSNTSPAALSPARQTFAPAQRSQTPTAQALPTTVRQAQEQNSSRHDGGRGKRDVNLALQSNPISPSRMERVSQNWAPEKSHLRLESPSDALGPNNDEHMHTSPHATRPKLREPVWNIDTLQQNGTSSIADSSESSSDHSASNSASSVYSASTPNDSPVEKIGPQVQLQPAAAVSRGTAAAGTLKPSHIPIREARAPSVPDTDRKRNESTGGRSKPANDGSKNQHKLQRLQPIPVFKASDKHSPSSLDLSRTSSPLDAVAAGESPIIGRVSRGFPNTKDRAHAGEDTKKKAKKKAGGDDVPEIRIGRKASEVGEIRVGFMIETGMGHAHRRSEQVVLEG